MASELRLPGERLRPDWMVALLYRDYDPVFPGGGFDSFLRGLGCSMDVPSDVFRQCELRRAHTCGKASLADRGVRGTGRRPVEQRRRGGEEEGLKRRR